MRKANWKEERSRKRLMSGSVGTFDRLEDRCLLAPVLLFGTVWEDLGGTVNFDGFISTRLISTQTGRIEVDPTGAFGNDVFVVSRGAAAGSAGIIPTPLNPGDVEGKIYRVDPYAVSAFGMQPAQNRQLFGAIPSGGVSFGGYEKWHDLAFNRTGSFSGVNGGPTLYVSTLDSTTTPGINPRNAIYGFRPDGSLVTPATGTNPTAAAAFSNIDAVHPGILDSQIGALAVAPGDAFGTDLFVFDVACDNEVGITCDAGDGNSIFRVRPLDVAANLPNPVNLDAPPAPLNGHVEGILPPLTPAPLNNDIDVRAMVFDPNRGIILGGQYGLPAFQLYGGLFVASSDLEAADTGVTRLLHFPSLGFPPIDLLAPVPVATRMIGDMAFDPVGIFGGGMFFTDYVTGTVFEVIQDPVTGTAALFPFATGFDVLCPSAVSACPAGSPAGITAAQSYGDAFSISFSADGEIMFVSDREGVWAFYANTLAHSASGASIGLTDIRELRAPYSGKGFAAAIIDTGVDGQHLAFQGTVSGGFNPVFPSTGNFDTDIHGTAVAGIVHQIAPDAVIVPINTLGFITGAASINEALYDSIDYVRDNPFVDDPRTPFINEAVNDPATPQDDRTRIVAANMSLGIRFPDDPDNSLDSERDAFTVDQSAVIPFKSVFSKYRELGIVPVAAAGNEGQLFNGMSGAIIPSILNEVIEVLAAYPWGPSPPLLGPPLTIPVPATGLPTQRCILETGDQIAFTGKITAFSNRNVTSDFAAPGTCVNSYAPSMFLSNVSPAAQALVTAPLIQEFNGTSSASPIVAGHFVFGYDVLTTWSAIAAAGGSISPVDSLATTADDKTAALNQYLVRDLLQASGLHIAPTTLTLGAAASHLTAYANQDGINSILQWTAIPREDVNIGEGFEQPDGSDDDVIQQRLLGTDRYRTYSHISMSNFLSAVEGSIALNFFVANPGELAQLAASAGVPGIITAADIDAYVANTTNTATERAMAHLLGGSDRTARLNRLSYLDIVQNERVDGGILADAASIAALQARILPRPDDFVITARHRAAEQPYALDSTALRNYHDLKFRPASSMFAPKIRGKLAKKSPDQFTFGHHGRLTLLPVPGRESPTMLHPPEFRIIGRTGSGVANPGGNQGGNQGGNTGGTITEDTRTAENFTVLDEGGSEFLYHTAPNGSLIEYARQDDGSWLPTNLTAATGGPIVTSDLIAIDLAGGSSRVVFGLTPDGHVARYEYTGASWIAEDVTAAANLPTIASSLTGLVLHRTTSDTTVLYGLDAAGQLIEYRTGRAGWTARNVSATTGGAPLEPKLVAWGETYGRKQSERVFVFGTTSDGHAVQYLSTGKRWFRIDLSSTGPTVTAASLVVLAPAVAGGVPSLFGLDGQGSLWRYTGNLRLGWESITNNFGGPALTGELGTQYAAGSGTMFVFGVDQQGRMIQYAGQSGNWSSSVIGSASPSPTGDVSASTNYRSVYGELVDGALAEFWLGDTWNMRRLDPDATTPGDGSTMTSQLIALAVASR